MGLLNYTTQVSPDRTAAEVQAMLVKAGATVVMAQYREGVLIGLSFQIDTQFGLRGFTVPVDAEPVYKVLLRQSTHGAKNKIPRSYATMEQATKVAWRIVKDWVEAQLAIIETEMVTLEQVMLPYMQTDQGSVYELWVNRQMALSPASEES